ncbi:MAG TPA: DNA polymerase III subunit delta [Candidatus Saccharibacteria bacterium]|nr:DNA polymerase III subunit delta [Candidatus Saccharibacteria bacterium]
MITLLMGENSYEIHHQLRQLAADFRGQTEKIDGAELELQQLPDLLMGSSLFSEKRLVIIRDLSRNKILWDKLPDWVGRISDDIHLVITEPKPDKRTKTYKALQKVATVIEHKPWGERDYTQAEKWVVVEAKARQLTLTPTLARLLVARVGVDQWQLGQALDKLRFMNTVTEEVITEVIDARPAENVFDLLETALRGDSVRVQEMIAALSQTDDAYQTFGLLSGQVFHLAALAVARDGDDVVRDLAVHPFVISKLRPYANRLGARKVGDIVNYLAKADETMKTTDMDPWLVAEHALLKVAGQ